MYRRTLALNSCSTESGDGVHNVCLILGFENKGAHGLLVLYPVNMPRFCVHLSSSRIRLRPDGGGVCDLRFAAPPRSGTVGAPPQGTCDRLQTRTSNAPTCHRHRTRTARACYSCSQTSARRTSCTATLLGATSQALVGKPTFAHN